MSSTNRGSTRSPNDYYQTDPKEVIRIWRRDMTGNPVFHETKLRVLPY